MSGTKSTDFGGSLPSMTSLPNRSAASVRFSTTSSDSRESRACFEKPVGVHGSSFRRLPRSIMYRSCRSPVASSSIEIPTACASKTSLILSPTAS